MINALKRVRDRSEVCAHYCCLHIFMHDERSVGGL